jgi:ABC-2 type transport system permease protein
MEMEQRRSPRENLRIIWAIAAKDMVDAIKNRTTISIVIGVALFMLSAQAAPLLLKLRPVPRAYYYDFGQSGRIAELAKGKEISLIKMPSQEAVEKTIAESAGATIGLIIPADFDQDVQAGEGVVLEGYYAHWANAADVGETTSFFEQELSAQIGSPVKINLEGNVIYPGPDADGQPFMISLSLMVMMLTMGGFLVPLLMVEEKEKHTMEALLVSPASFSQVVLGKVIAGIFYCLTAAAVVLLINHSMVHQWGLAILAVVCGGLFTVAIGLLVGTLFENQGTMNLWLGLILLMLILPVFLAQTMGERLPQIFSAIIPWLPSMAMSKVVKISFSNSLPVEQLLMNVGIMVGFSVVLVAMVVGRMRRTDR